MATQSPRTGKPNVLVILTDDQGYGDLSCHGHPMVKTPALDRLAAESVRLHDFHVAPMCTPTRSQLMTGVDCLRNGSMATSLGRHLPRLEFPMMPQFFKNSGYRTGIFGKWHLGSHSPYLPEERGFDEAIYHHGFGLTGADDYWNNDYFDPIYRHNGEIKQAKGYCTDFWFDAAMHWMGEAGDAGDPFFCYLPTNVPHFPMWVEDQYKEDYRSAGKTSAGFFGMIANLDENIARLDRFLAEKGLRDDTIVIFMTDNGHAGGALDIYNAGMRGGKCQRYEGGHRVPCFVRWPNGRLGQPRDERTPTQVQDILPTLVDLCALADKPDERPAFDGASLANLLRGQPHHLDSRTFVVQYFQNDIRMGDSAVVHGGWRLVWGSELFNIHDDLAQEHDLAKAHPAIVEQLKAAYEPWWAGVEPHIANFVPSYLPAQQGAELPLTSCEWRGVRADGIGNVRAAEARGSTRGGPWHLSVPADGRYYRVELRRWPRESGLVLDEGAPEFHARVDTVEAGVAVPITGAVLIGPDGSQFQDGLSRKHQATFTVDLKRGKTDLHGYFVDASRNDACGAYYAYLSRDIS